MPQTAIDKIDRFVISLGGKGDKLNELKDLLAEVAADISAERTKRTEEFVSGFLKLVEVLSTLLENQKEMSKSLEKLSGLKFPEIKFPTSISIKNPVREVSIINPVEQIAVKNPEMTVKNISDLAKAIPPFSDKVIVDQMQQTNMLLAAVLKELSEHKGGRSAVMMAGTRINVRRMLGQLIREETPRGTIDGSNTDFYLSRAPFTEATLWLVRDDRMQTIDSDFTLSGARIRYTVAPRTGTVHIAKFL